MKLLRRPNNSTSSWKTSGPMRAETRPDPGRHPTIGRAFERQPGGLDDLVEQRIAIAAKLAARIHLLSQVTDLQPKACFRPACASWRPRWRNGARAEAADSGQLSVDQSGDARSIISLIPQRNATGLIEAIRNNILMISEAEKPTEIDLLLFPLRKSLTELSKLSQNVPAPVKIRLAQQVNSLAALGVGPLSVAAVRKDELAILEQANALLAVNAQLSTDLTNEVSSLGRASKHRHSEREITRVLSAGGKPERLADRRSLELG